MPTHLQLCSHLLAQLRLGCRQAIPHRRKLRFCAPVWGQLWRDCIALQKCMSEGRRRAINSALTAANGGGANAIKQERDQQPEATWMHSPPCYSR